MMNCNLMKVFVSAIAVSAFMPLCADETISANTTLVEDRIIDGVLTIAEGVTIDLAGYKLTAHFAGQPESAATITSSTAGGELHAIVDEAYNNDKIELTGSLKLVKEGVGTWTATKTDQSYTGGTLVSQGVLQISQRANMTTYVIPRSGATEVGPDGRLEASGSYVWGLHSTILNGGTFSNYVGGYTGNQSINGASMTLTDDSSFRIGVFTVEWNVLSLGGHTLSVNIDEGATWSRGNTLTGPGTIDVSGYGVFHTRGAMNAPTVDLRVACPMNIANEFNVKDYYANYSGTSNAGTAALKVNGVFTPVTDSFYGCTMMNGSTIDLSSKTGVWSATSTFTAGSSAVLFASGATVTIDVHGRTFEVGDQVVSWAVAPAGTTFQWDEATAANGVDLVANENGIFYGSPDGSVATAIWAGAVDADVSKPGNWVCRDGDGQVVPNALPGVFTAVEIAGPVKVEIPSDATFRYATLSLNCSLTADCDWSGLTRVAGSVDLKGKKLTLTTLAGSGTITDSTGSGELYVDVAAESTSDNAAVALTGKLTLVKKGEGTLVATKTGQSYTGQTRIAEGTFRVNNQAASNFVVPRNSLIVPEQDGTLDINGSASWGYHSVSNNGGRIYNANPNHTGFRSMNFAHHYLGADSTIHVDADTVYWTPLDLNGNTLNVEIAANKTLHVGLAVNGPGMIDIKYGGWLHPRQAISMPDVDFKVGCALNLEYALTVHDYIPAYAYNANKGAAALNVTGTFKPPTGHHNFYGCTMQNGSTLDISSVSGPFNMKSAFTAGKNVIGFEEGATVCLDVGSRTVSSREPLLEWPEGSEPENIDSVRFVLSGGRKTGYFVKKDCGLYFMSGLAILIR